MTKKFFLIAGEQSGDVLGSKLIKELKQQLASQNQQAEFVGVGGKLMQEEGFISIFPMEELAVMGFLEIVPHIPQLLRRIKQTAEMIVKEKPDFIITIDSPDFCFRVMKRIFSLASRLGKENIVPGKRVHLIAPSVWAYRAGRAKKISKLYDLLLAILPFEPPYFEKHGLKTVFIGHPIVENLLTDKIEDQKKLGQEFRQRHFLKDDDLLICVTPGSRNSEVKKIFPEFIAAINLLAEKKSDVKVVIPLVEKTRELVTEMAKSLKVKYFLIEKEEKESAFFATNFALAKSGTNAVEFSLHHVPLVVAYKINPITHFLVKRMVKIKFANLVNLISNEEIIPEMLQDKCEAKQLFSKLNELIENKELAKKQVDKSITALRLIGLGSEYKPSAKAVREILSFKI